MGSVFHKVTSRISRNISGTSGLCPQTTEPFRIWNFQAVFALANFDTHHSRVQVDRAQSLKKPSLETKQSNILSCLTLSLLNPFRSIIFHRMLQNQKEIPAGAFMSRISIPHAKIQCKKFQRRKKHAAEISGNGLSKWGKITASHSPPS